MQSSLELGPMSQDPRNSERATEFISSRSRLISPNDPLEAVQIDNTTGDEHPSHSAPPRNSSEAPWVLQSDDPYDSPIFWIIFTGLLLYTVAAMILAAWYLAWHIGPEFYSGIKASLIMAGILLVAAVGPFYEDYQRLKHPL